MEKIEVTQDIVNEAVKRLASEQLRDLGSFLTTFPEARYQGKNHSYDSISSVINNINGTAVMNVDAYIRNKFPKVYEEAEDHILPSSEDIWRSYKEQKPTPVDFSSNESRRLD